MKKLIIICTAILIFSCSGDFGDVVDFTRVENPNLSEGSVVGQPNSASIWLSGLERQLALVFNETLVLAELGSDNYVNTQTFFNQFMDAFDTAIGINTKPAYYLAIARANYYLGNKVASVEAASAALALSTDFNRFVLFDEANGPSNTFESALYQRATFDDLQPLPTLDFLDPKYSFLTVSQAAPVHYLKAEEAYLILAEAAFADNDIAAARSSLTAMFNLIATREIRTIGVSIEQRSQVDEGSRPDNASVIVNGIEGLVLDRQSGDVNIPSVSGTSLTTDDIANMQDNDTGLSLLYKTRQEVFIAEGLRFVDLGVKLVIDENEILLNENISEGDLGTTPFVPSFISEVVSDLDAITYDANAGIATTVINLNNILVAKKSSDQVVPFE